MNIYFDFEFDRAGPAYWPISLGLVRSDGEELYIEFEFDKSKSSKWVIDNVIPHLSKITTSSEKAIKELIEFCGSSPTFWANYGAYDWFMMCELFGGLMNIPLEWPSYFHEIQTLYEDGRKEPEGHPSIHHALEDARWNKKLMEST